MTAVKFTNIYGVGFGLNRLKIQFPTEANPVPTFPMSQVLTVCGLPLWQVNAAVGLETELIEKWEGNQ